MRKKNKKEQQELPNVHEQIALLEIASIEMMKKIIALEEKKHSFEDFILMLYLKQMKRTYLLIEITVVAIVLDILWIVYKSL